jgi:hypothetical protein
MSKLLLALCLVLALGSCTTWPHPTPAPHTAQAPRRWVRYYHHEQRQNERARRRLVKANITWSKL